MKCLLASRALIAPAALILWLTSGCGHRQQSCQTALVTNYVHRYGMALDQKEWDTCGRNGQVIATRKDGVVEQKLYQHGLLHGEATYTFPHSNITALTETYVEDKLVATQEHYPCGTPATRKEYLANGQTILTSWYMDGTPQLREVWDENFLTSGQYFTPNHLLEGEVNEGQGKRILRDATTLVRCEDTIFAGQMVTRTEFYPNQMVESITHFCNGKTHGKRRTFSPAGALCLVEDWVQGELHGEVIAYQNAEPKCVTPYVHGKKEGIERYYGPNGVLAQEICWIHGEMHGPSRVIAGNVETVDWYHHGDKVHKNTFRQLNPLLH